MVKWLKGVYPNCLTLNLEQHSGSDNNFSPVNFLDFTICRNNKKGMRNYLETTLYDKRMALKYRHLHIIKFPNVVSFLHNSVFANIGR